jgi:hypothetical protein
MQLWAIAVHRTKPETRLRMIRNHILNTLHRLLLVLQRHRLNNRCLISERADYLLMATLVNVESFRWSSRWLMWVICVDLCWWLRRDEGISHSRWRRGSGHIVCCLWRLGGGLIALGCGLLLAAVMVDVCLHRAKVRERWWIFVSKNKTRFCVPPAKKIYCVYLSRIVVTQIRKHMSKFFVTMI